MISRKILHLSAEENYPLLVTDIYKPKKDKPFNKNRMPTFPLHKFEGTYAADGFGKIQII